jgi:hypothetical protein
VREAAKTITGIRSVWWRTGAKVRRSDHRLPGQLQVSFGSGAEIAVLTFVMLTRVQPGIHQRAVLHLEERTMAHIRRVPARQWLHSWTLLRPYDYLDVFQALDPTLR